MGEAAKPRSVVAVSMGETANRSGIAMSMGKLQTFVSACPLASPCLWGKLQKPRWFWCADVAVSMGEACSTQYYWERLCASFVVHSSTGKCFVQDVWYTVVLERVCASFVIHSSTGKCFVQDVWYTVVLERVCASFVIHSSTGKCFVQAL